MRNKNESLTPQIETAQKMTKNRLYKLLEEMNLNYTLEGAANNFRIIIEPPFEHRQEKDKLLKTAVLNSAHQTEFEREKISPFLKKIKTSTNFDCTLEIVDNKYVISVFKK